MPPRPTTTGRRGNYAVLFVLSIPVMLGFGALAVDTSFIRLTQSQAQDVADAASQAALLTLRRTGDKAEAEAIAKRVVELNSIGGEPGVLQDLRFGSWDETADPPMFVENGDNPNAVRVTVSREGSRSVPLFLARIWGYDSFEVSRSATSAARDLQVVLVMDITNSWHPRNFEFAREGAVRFFDTIEAAHGPQDRIGMSIFTNRFGWEFTPLTTLDDPARNAAIRAQWADMRTASKAGDGTNWPDKCRLNSRSKKNDFTDPPGGCYPNMPREYRDEPGTDHTTGMEMARIMMEEDGAANAFSVQVIMTDGYPNGVRYLGTTRAAQGWVEPWREWTGPVPHDTNDIRNDAIALARAMWDDPDLRVHTYVVSFVADDWFMDLMPQGQGYYVRTSDPAALIPIFEDIANSLPIAIVE